MADMNEPLKPINTSIYDFPELIKGGYAYVDKTAQLYELVKPGAAPIDFAKKFNTMTLDSPDALTAPTVALLYQGGYLTIDRRIDGETVLLRIPNHEVRNSLYRGYMSKLVGNDFELDDFSLTAKETAAELFADETGAKFAALLKTAFAKIPHEWLGKTEKAIYIVEFKYSQSAEAALRQCREKRYADAYADDSRRVVYVGVNYDPAARTIGEVKTEAAMPQVNNFGDRS